MNISWKRPRADCVAFHIAVADSCLWYTKQHPASYNSV